ncbi:MAG: PD-(D/E)XK nuclease family protein [Oscillospiraceae bacterium]|nr:PD-(D/E)XK nuclease family protein [Oscillospiraceae bacterium]
MSTFGVEDDEESPTAIKIEAEYIAQKIKRLINERYQVPDDDGSERDITFSDIVILLRSVKGRAWQYAAALSEIDIPIEFPGGEGYFETTEVITALSLLAVIDNPIQDIPLASVMNSPLYNFTADELAELKLKSREKDLYSSIKESAERDIVSDETRVKCKKMLSDIDDLRIMSGDISSDRFIWNMYNRTGLLDLVSKMRGGEKRKGNLILLAESAKQFERSGYKGVYGFLRFIKNLQDRGIELTDRVNDKSTFPESYNSVKIMSIHKSKGLEFPIVILANTSKFNNFQDIRKNVVFHNELGLGVMLTDPTQRIRYSTLARTAIQNKLNDEMLSEELRVLYVAMTRAREKLIITATLKNTERTKEQLEEIPAGIVDPQAALALKSMIEWILVGIRGIEDAELSINYLDSGIIESIRNLASGAEKKIVPLPLTGVTYESDLSADSSRETISETDSRFSYPFKSSVDLPSKLTVTGLKALLDPEAELAPWVQKEKEKSAPVSSPLFISGNKELTAADQGTLMHLVLQHIDYKKSSHEHDNNRVAKELQRLSNIGFLTNEQIDKINIGKIKKLLSSTLGVRMTAAKMMEREFKFSILRPAEEFYPGGGTEKILLQGVVDCFFEEDNEIVVVDFKTNRVTEKNVDKIAQQYSQQLNTYADALHHITGKHVKEKIIYFFSIDHAYIL